MTALSKHNASEYLRGERQAETKSEFVNGEIYAMAGASRAHNTLCANLLASLHGQLRDQPCQVWSNDMRVKVDETGLYTYPDVLAVCEPRFEDGVFDTLLNPCVLIEVLSEGTEKFDRGGKFQHYQRLPSLQVYVLVAQDQIRLETYTRQADTWQYRVLDQPQQCLDLPCIGCQLSVAEVYRKLFT
jgi:Uma2 family endonuclease